MKSHDLGLFLKKIKKAQQVKNDYFVKPFLTRNFFQESLGLEGSKFSWEKNPVSYEQIFRQNFLAQNFLRKFWLDFSQPSKF